MVPLKLQVQIMTIHSNTYMYAFLTVYICEELTLDNGNISYSSDQYIFGSVATHTCYADNGYVLSYPNITTRACLLDGWSGSEISCQCIIILSIS